MDRNCVRPVRATRVAALLGALVLAAGCSGDERVTAPPIAGVQTGALTVAPTPSGAPAALKLGLPGFPDAVTDGAGRAVYTFTGDRHGNTTCFDACAKEWPPVLTAGVPTSVGLDPARVGQEPRGDGTWQASYGGNPLYYFSGDTKPGTSHGKGRAAFDENFFLILKNTNGVG